MGTTDATTYAIAESGPGHSLVVPYYTAQNGQMTVLHLVNTDVNNGKAVKLRFRGANNGDGLLHMTVLLAPGDVWTGAVTAGANGIAQLTTADATCTSPRLAPGVAQAFITERLNPCGPPTCRPTTPARAPSRPSWRPTFPPPPFMARASRNAPPSSRPSAR